MLYAWLTVWSGRRTAAALCSLGGRAPVKYITVLLVQLQLVKVPVPATSRDACSLLSTQLCDANRVSTCEGKRMRRCKQSTHRRYAVPAQSGPNTSKSELAGRALQWGM